MVRLSFLPLLLSRFGATSFFSFFSWEIGVLRFFLRVGETRGCRQSATHCTCCRVAVEVLSVQHGTAALRLSLLNPIAGTKSPQPPEHLMSASHLDIPATDTDSLPRIPATPREAPAASASMLEAVVQQGACDRNQTPEQVQSSPRLPGQPRAVEPEDAPSQVIAENGVQAEGHNEEILCFSCGKRYSDEAMLDMHKRISCRSSFYGGRTSLHANVQYLQPCSVLSERPRVLQTSRNPRRLVRHDLGPESSEYSFLGRRIPQ